MIALFEKFMQVTGSIIIIWFLWNWTNKMVHNPKYPKIWRGKVFLMLKHLGIIFIFVFGGLLGYYILFVA